MSEAGERAADILHREALALDERRWDDWLALFDEKVEFWVPAWKSEDEATDDPANEVSLIYASARSELEDRVWRVRSGRSIASVPLPRTAHIVTNILAAPEGNEAIEVRSIWTTHVFNVKRREEHLFFSRCRHRIVRAGANWLIRRRKAILLNDTLPTMLDFYTI
jgi:3-phenylpropionate/cinnamic acid dioxygenase small subunit